MAGQISQISAAYVHNQSIQYTEARVHALEVRLEVMQAHERAEDEAQETHRLRERFALRVTFIAVTMLLAYFRDDIAGWAGFATIMLSSAPDVCRECVELFRKY